MVYLAKIFLYFCLNCWGESGIFRTIFLFFKLVLKHVLVSLLIYTVHIFKVHGHHYRQFVYTKDHMRTCDANVLWKVRTL